MLCAVLLLLGLFSRLAAGAMLVQSLLLHMQGASSDIYLFWAALLGWIVVMGPGSFSLDYLLNRGAGTSAVPGVASFRGVYCWVTLHLGPWYKLVIRVWLATAPAAAALSVLGMSSAAQRTASATWLPRVPEMVHSLPPAIALLLAALFVFGLGTRPIASVADLGPNQPDLSARRRSAVLAAPSRDASSARAGTILVRLVASTTESEGRRRAVRESGSGAIPI
jgi:hypothetical protein